MIEWSEMREWPYELGGTVVIKTAITAEGGDRFYIYRPNPTTPSYWILYDQHCQRQYPHMASSWVAAQVAAAETIRNLLATEAPVAEA